MSQLQGRFGDQFAGHDSAEPNRADQLRDEIAATLEVELSPPQRMACVAGGGLSIGLAAGFGMLARRRWGELPLAGDAIVAAGPLAMLLVGLVLIGVARRGAFERRSHGTQLLGVALILCLGLGTAFLFTGWRSGDGRLVFGGTVMLVLGGGGFLLHLLEQHHLATQQRLLELELQMAELATEIKHPPHGES